MGSILTAVYPALMILRMVDSNQPVMDRLYYFVRMLDRSVTKAVQLLNEVEKGYSKVKNASSVRSRMLDHYLKCASEADKVECVKEWYKTLNRKSFIDDENNSSDDESSTDDERQQKEDEDSDTDDDEVPKVTGVEIPKSTFGDKVEEIWMKRRVNLAHDVAVAAWLVSPIPWVRKDVEQHSGVDRNRCENLFKQWFGHEVSILMLYCLCIVVSI